MYLIISDKLVKNFLLSKVEILLNIINKPSCNKRILLKFEGFELSEYGIGVHITMGKKRQGNTTPEDEKKGGCVTFQ